MKLRSWLLIYALLSAFVPVHGQEGPAGKASDKGTQANGEEITRQLTDENKKPIPNAQVEVKTRSGKVVANVKTDANGNFTLRVPVGEDVEVTVSTEDGSKIVENIGRGLFNALRQLPLTRKPASAPSAPALVEVKGFISGPDDKPVLDYVVKLQAQDGQLITVKSKAKDETGEFKAKVVNDQSYDLTIEAPGFAPATMRVSKEGLQLTHTFLLSKRASDCCQAEYDHRWEIRLLGGGILLVYWLIALAVRQHNMIQIDRRMLHANVQTVQQRGAIGASSPALEAVGEVAPTKPLGQLLHAATSILAEAAKGVLPTFFFGSRGHELAARINLNAAEIEIAKSYARDEILSALRIAVEALRPEYSQVATKVEATLNEAKDDTTPSTEFLRATLLDALRCINEKSEAAALSVMNWQNKAFALVFIACLLLTVMTWTVDNVPLLLVGFIGGFASRLMRGRTASSGDGTLTWTTLFLSPVYGAFTGWAGVLLVSGLTSLHLLGTAFGEVRWDQGWCSSAAMALAFLFGFSERFFSAVTQLAEDALTRKENASAADTSQNKPAPTDPKAGVPVSTATKSKVTVAVWNATEKLLTLAGEGLDSVKAVTLQLSAAGTPVILQIVNEGRTATSLSAKAPAAAPAAGIYEVMLDGKSAGKQVTITS
jgi:hypothetical protein